MLQRVAAASAVIFLLACSGAAPEDGEPRPTYEGPVRSTGEANRDFGEVRTGFIEWYFEAHPVRASELGVHDYDTRMPDLTRAGVQRRIDELLDWLADLEELPFDLMEEDNRYDYAILEYGIRAELLDLEEARSWANNPRVYSDVIGRGLASIAERESRPFDERVEPLAARMRASIPLLEAVRRNVRNPPRLWTEMAVAETRGLMEYVAGLPAVLSIAPDSLPPALEAARSELSSALDGHLLWLVSDLLPRSNGSFRLGRYLLERKLLYSEHISLGLTELQRLNGSAVSEYRRRIEELAREIDPDRTTREVVDSVRGLYPPPEELVATAREMMAEARAWVAESGVVAVPDGPVPTVRASPPYAREAFATLQPPGTFDADSLEVFFSLTGAQADWEDALIHQHMAYFNYGALRATALQETYPGRYVQYRYARELPDLRKIFTPRSFSDGWAHYAAEMAVEEGASDDPAVRLGQLQRALQRHARWYAVIQLHALDAPLDRVVRTFMEIAYMDEFPARRDVIRATTEPTLLAEALGRMQVLELRGDYREHLEERREEFTLARFHEVLLRTGLPLALAREALMPRPRDSRRRRGRPGPG